MGYPASSPPPPTPPAGATTLTSLASEAHDAAAGLEALMARHGLGPPPSLEADRSAGAAGARRDWADALPFPEVAAARSRLVDAAQALLDLALGPWDRLAALTGPRATELEVLRAVEELGVAEAVPLPTPRPWPAQKGDEAGTGGQQSRGDGGEGGEGEDGGEEEEGIDIADLARKVGVADQAALLRQLRFACVTGMFREPRPGRIAHTALSATIPAASAWTRMRLGRWMGGAAGHVAEALRSSSPSPSPRTTAIGARKKKPRTPAAETETDGQDPDDPTGAAEEEEEAEAAGPSHRTVVPCELADPAGRGRPFWAQLQEDYPGGPGAGMDAFSRSMQVILAMHTGNSPFVPYAQGIDWEGLLGAGGETRGGREAGGGGGRVGGGGQREVVVVDVGGGNAHIEVGCLTATTPRGDSDGGPMIPPGVRFVVQDLPGNEAPARAAIASLPAGAARRVAFQAHDFFGEQPPLPSFDAAETGGTAGKEVAGEEGRREEEPVVAAYMLSRILHDWQDADCARILRPLVRAIESRSSCSRPQPKIILVERVLPDHPAEEEEEEEEDDDDDDEAEAEAEAPSEPGAGGAEKRKQQQQRRPALANHSERMLRTQDLLMYTLFGGGERTAADWARVLAAADPRLRVARVARPPGSLFDFMEVVLG